MRHAGACVKTSAPTTVANVRNFGDAMAIHGRVVVLGSEQAIGAANAELPCSLSLSRVV